MLKVPRIIAVVIVAWLTGACATLRIAGLIPYYNGLDPNRVAATAAPLNGNTPNDAYVLQDGDTLEISLVPVIPNRTASGVTLESFGGSVILVHDVFAARISIGFFRALEDLAILATAEPKPACKIPLGTPRPETWGQLRALLESRTVPCDSAPGATSWRVALTLHPRTPHSARPGDLITLHRSYVPLDSKGTESPLSATDDFQLTVDPDGYVLVPIPGRISGRYSEIGRLGDEMASGKQFFGHPDFRRQGAHIERAYARVRVWSENNAPTLDDVSDCLSISSSAWQDPRTCRADQPFDPPIALPSGFLDRCRAMGVGDQFRVCQPTGSPVSTSAGGARTVHYFLEPLDVSWTLVDEAGRRLQVAFVHGRNVEDAVVASYRTQTGRELIGPAARRAWLVVVPDRQSDQPTPFVIQAGSAPMPLLRPRDTVFVTRTRPR